mmetsp:Transcript_40605/g.88757  ORF Transcript_40605/g.88757 Transcript_40605/m.88757 type:complete len:269 (-) Transcript_40605:900-1706(-)
MRHCAAGTRRYALKVWLPARCAGHRRARTGSRHASEGRARRRRACPGSRSRRGSTWEGAQCKGWRLRCRRASARGARHHGIVWPLQTHQRRKAGRARDGTGTLWLLLLAGDEAPISHGTADAEVHQGPVLQLWHELAPGRVLHADGKPPIATSTGVLEEIVPGGGVGARADLPLGFRRAEEHEVPTVRGPVSLVPANHLRFPHAVDAVQLWVVKALQVEGLHERRGRLLILSLLWLGGLLSKCQRHVARSVLANAARHLRALSMGCRC